MNSADWRPTAPLENLRRRAAITQSIRGFFHERGFFEIETPLLSRDTVVDTHLDPVPVRLSWNPAAPLDGETYYLQTSPEFALKRLVAAGAEAVFEITKAFRLAEEGPLHNVEFTLVEWYRVGDDLHAGMQLLSDLAEAVLQRGPAERITYAQLFQQHLNMNPLTASGAELKAAAEARRISVPQSYTDEDRDALLELLLSEAIQPHLGRDRPTILYHYPASQAALARLAEPEAGTQEKGAAGKKGSGLFSASTSQEAPQTRAAEKRPDPFFPPTDAPPNLSPQVACRFELFVDGIELANGYDELLDPEVLRQRNQANNQARANLGKPTLPEQSRLIEAMHYGLPPCSGCALGLDRLVMLALGAKTIEEVMPFPTRRA